MRRSIVVGAVVFALSVAAPAAHADVAATPGADSASCLGLGSSFYGRFAPQQRAFVAAFVNERDGPAGQYYLDFATEKEGGAIPAPCGTRIE